MSVKELSLSERKEDFSYTIAAPQRGMRLDQFLAQMLPDASRALITLSNKKGCILVGDEAKKSSYRLKEGEEVHGFLWQTEPPKLEAKELDLTILYEDEYLIVLSKAPGLVVHPGSGNTETTLVHGLLHHCQEIQDVGDDAIRPGIVHRLDKDTSGIMLVAKTDVTLRKLVDAFRDRKVHKLYYAIIAGIPYEYEGRIVAPIGRHPVSRQKMAVNERTGKFAASNWQLVEEFEEHSLVRVHIETGRTHQIRVHMSHMGFPIVGDQVYGRKKQYAGCQRQMLHASKLRFTHPITGKEMTFTAPLWDDFQEVLYSMGWSGSLA